MNVISLDDARAERQPHWMGTVHCVGCHHEWQAVAPIGDRWIDCPECGFPKGTPKYPFGAAVGDLLLTCGKCEGETLTAYHNSGRIWVRCMGCGNDMTDGFYGESQ